MELSTTKLGHRAEWWELVAGWTEHLLSCNILTPHPHPGCDLARPWGHGADRNLNFRMSVQAGCCVGTSAGDYPINPVEWSPVTSPGCPGKWGLKHSNQDENNYKLVNHQYSSVQSTFLFVCWVCSKIFKIQFLQHTARRTAVDNLWRRFQWHWHEGSNAIKHRRQLGTWLTLLACRPRHNTTYKPPSNDSCPLHCPECPGSVYGGISQDTNTNL